MMVVEGATGKVLGDIPNTPGVHGAGIATKAGHGFTTNSGDQTVTMFDLKTLAVLKQIKVGPGLDGIMYDEPDDKIILTNHSRPIGTLTAIDPQDRRHRRHRRTRGHRAGRGRGRRQGTHLRQQREQEHDPGHRREDVEGDRVVAARAVRRPDRHRLRQGDEPDLLGLQQDVGRRRREHRQGRRVDHERHARRRARMGSGEEADLHSERRRGQRHGRAPGFRRQVHRRRDGRRPSPARRRSPSIRRRTTSTCSSPSAVRRRRPPPDAPPPAAGRGRGRGPQGPIVAAWFIVIKQ